MTDERLDGYLEAVFPPPPEARATAHQDAYERRAARMQKSRWAARWCFETGLGNQQPQVRGTLWAAYNGVTEYVDHCVSVVGKRRKRPATTPDRRLRSIWFVDGHYTKARAYREACNLLPTL